MKRVTYFQCPDLRRHGWSETEVVTGDDPGPRCVTVRVSSVTVTESLEVTVLDRI